MTYNNHICLIGKIAVEEAQLNLLMQNLVGATTSCAATHVLERQWCREWSGEAMV